MLSVDPNNNNPNDPNDPNDRMTESFADNWPYGILYPATGYRYLEWDAEIRLERREDRGNVFVDHHIMQIQYIPIQ